jgi:hypothetical protein
MRPYDINYIIQQMQMVGGIIDDISEEQDKQYQQETAKIEREKKDRTYQIDPMCIGIVDGDYQEVYSTIEVISMCDKCLTYFEKIETAEGVSSRAMSMITNIKGGILRLREIIKEENPIEQE